MSSKKHVLRIKQSNHSHQHASLHEDKTTRLPGPSAEERQSPTKGVDSTANIKLNRQLMHMTMIWYAIASDLGYKLSRKDEKTGDLRQIQTLYH